MARRLARTLVTIFRQRLNDEFGIDAIVTPPKVPDTITYLRQKVRPGRNGPLQYKGHESSVCRPASWHGRFSKYQKKSLYRQDLPRCCFERDIDIYKWIQKELKIKVCMHELSKARMPSKREPI